MELVTGKIPLPPKKVMDEKGGKEEYVFGNDVINDLIKTYEEAKSLFLLKKPAPEEKIQKDKVMEKLAFEHNFYEVERVLYENRQEIEVELAGYFDDKTLGKKIKAAYDERRKQQRQ